MAKPQPKSVISIDVGRRRIGLAGCDPLGITIKHLPTIQRGEFNRDLQTLKNHCLRRRVEGLVIGLPLNEKGLPTPQSNHCMRYGKKLAQALDLPIAWVNEHSSTWGAADRYNLKRDRTGQIDSAAAALLLDQWLHEGPELKPVHMTTSSVSQVKCDCGS